MLNVFREDVDVMSSGAVGVISRANSVYVNGLRLMTLGGITSEEGVMETASETVFAENIPICRLTDIASSLLFGKSTVIAGSPDTFST